jgi:hypothetical protein
MGLESIRRLEEGGGRTATDADFHRVVRLQVYLPLGGGAVLIATAIGVGLLTAGGGGATTRGMADVSLVLLLMPLIILGLIALVGMTVVAFGVAKVIGWIPPRSRKVQRIVARVAHQSDAVAERVVQAVVTPKSIWAAARAAIGSLQGRR